MSSQAADKACAIPPIQADQCQVWWATSTVVPPGLIRVLDTEERERLQQLHRKQDRALGSGGSRLCWCPGTGAAS